MSPPREPHRLRWRPESRSYGNGSLHSSPGDSSCGDPARVERRSSRIAASSRAVSRSLVTRLSSCTCRLSFAAKPPRNRFARCGGYERPAAGKPTPTRFAIRATAIDVNGPVAVILSTSFCGQVTSTPEISTGQARARSGSPFGGAVSRARQVEGTVIPVPAPTRERIGQGSGGTVRPHDGATSLTGSRIPVHQG